MKELLVFENKNNKELSNPSKVFDRIKKINIDHKQENLIVLCMDSKNNLIKAINLFKGGLNSCLIDPKTIFRTALKYNANSLIIAHNHPSGDLNPSSEDEIVYKQLKKGGDVIQLKVLDFIIFNKKEYYSLNRGVI